MRKATVRSRLEGRWPYRNRHLCGIPNGCSRPRRPNINALNRLIGARSEKDRAPITTPMGVPVIRTLVTVTD